MKVLAALLLLATLVSCAGPTPGPVGEVAVVEPGVVCRAGHNGGPGVADRGIGGTGMPAKGQFADRGIGGTGIVGVVTGFASICVDGVEVRFDKSVPISINGAVATAGQLRVGQLVVIDASRQATIPDSGARARTISVRHEVSGPIESVDTGADAIMVAGQRVAVLPTTWVAGRFGVGDWVAVSGLRQEDGTIVASRLDPARVGTLAVRGRISRAGDTIRIGNLILHEPVAATVTPGSFVSVMGRYRSGAVEVTAIDADPLLEDPTAYFGPSTDHVIVQAFVHVERGTVWLNNRLRFRAAATVQGQGSGYRNAIVWLERTADGAFTATALHYTGYRAQPRNEPSRTGGHGGGDMVLPPDPPPGPPSDNPPAGATDGDTGTVGDPSPGDIPAANAPPSKAEPSTTAPVADVRPAWPSGKIPVVRVAAGD
jgi:hypothetical protein